MDNRIFILFLTVNLIIADYVLGPYEIKLKQFGKCSDEGTKEIQLQNAKVQKKSKKISILSFNMILAKDIHFKLFNLDLDIAAMGGNGVWREHYYYQKCGSFCDTFKLMLPNFFNNLMKASGASCSKVNQKGNYSVQNMDSTIDFHLPFIPMNNYKIDAVVLKKQKRVGCFQLFVDVTPKRTSMI